MWLGFGEGLGEGWRGRAPAGKCGTAPSIAGVPQLAESTGPDRRRSGSSVGAGARLRSLDGLRGVAAAVVVVHHALLMHPEFSDAYKVQGGPVEPTLVAWIMTYTPLHLLWAGGEAVIVFFVLSGLVLTLPALRAGFSWPAYYVKRLLRLYLPILAGVSFAALTLLVVPRYLDDDLSGWVNGRAREYTPAAFLQDVWLLDGASGVVSPLWSLTWEILFSLLLPLYVLAAVLVRRHLLLIALVAGGLVAVALVSDRGMFYLSVFGLGALLAASWPRLAAAFGDLRDGRTTHALWRVTVVAAFLLLAGRWLVPASPRGPFPVTVEPGWETVGGAVLLIVCTGFFRPFRRALEAPVPQWLGRISFSLYLIHEPVLLAVRFLLPRAALLVVVVLGLFFCVVVAGLFTRWVEIPSHRLARRLGSRAQAWGHHQGARILAVSESEPGGSRLRRLAPARAPRPVMAAAASLVD